MTNLNPNPAKTAAQHGEFDGADQFKDVEFIIKQGRIKRVLTRGMSKFGINHGGVNKMFSLALYYKLRYALAIIGYLLGCILVLFGIPFLFYVIR